METINIYPEVFEEFISIGFTESQAKVFFEIYLNKQQNKSQQIIDISTTYKFANSNEYDDIALQNESDDYKIDHSKLIGSDSNFGRNIFKTRPDAIVITDTYNHPLFPITPHPSIDKSKFNLPTIQNRFKERYGKMTRYLPWHFIVEFINSDYYVFNTRPIDIAFPISTSEAKIIIDDNNTELNDRSESYFKNRPFDLKSAIHIGIIGDSNKDIYIKDIYKTISLICIKPFLKYFRIPASLWSTVYLLNMGPNFKEQVLERYFK